MPDQTIIELIKKQVEGATEPENHSTKKYGRNCWIFTIATRTRGEYYPIKTFAIVEADQSPPLYERWMDEDK